MDAIWILLLKEVVLPAVKEAIRSEFDPKETESEIEIAEKFITETLINAPKEIAEKIARNEKEKAHIKDGLTNIFRSILRVFK